MIAGADTFAHFIKLNERVRFVTFNFDTFVERRMREIIERTYPGEDTSRLEGYCPVIHVHGTLKPVPRGPFTFDQFNVNKDWKRWIHDSAGHINVTADTIGDEVLASAQHAVKDSSILCFLGFGYNHTNMKRLGILPKIAIGQKSGVFGSAHGLSESDRANAALWFVSGEELKLGGLKDDCLQVLKNLHVIHEV